MNKYKVSKDGKFIFQGKFTWEMLHDSGVSADQSDIRFTLYDKEKKQVNAFMFDIDDCPKEDGDDFCVIMEEILGKVQMYLVHTGGGYHIYVPLVKPVPFKDIMCYRKSWLSKLDEFKHRVNDSRLVYDDQPFNSHVSGRIPGARNSKNQQIVKLVDYNDYPQANHIEQVLEWTAPPQYQVTATKDGTYDPGQFCLVMDYIRDFEGEKIPYKVWKFAMATLASVGDEATAMELAKISGWPEKKAQEFFKDDKQSYHFNCMGVPTNVFEGEQSPCYECPHYISGSSPSFVSGELPTPYASTGYHPLDKDGNVSTAKIVASSVVNHWINLNKHQYRTVGGHSLYKWTGQEWRLEGVLNPNKNDFPRAVFKELVTISKHTPTSTHYVKELMGVFCHQIGLDETANDDIFNPEDKINLENGVLNLNTLEVVDHHPDHFMQGILPLTYDPEAECPEWYKFLDSAIPDGDDQILLQVFMALAITNINPSKYLSQYLWLKGNPGTGKTILLYVIMQLVGKDNWLAKSPTACQSKDGGVVFDYRGKKVLIFNDFKADSLKGFVKTWEAFINNITDGFAVDIREVYAKSINSIPTVTTFVSSNDDPIMSDSTSGTLRRVRMIHLYNIPVRPDRMLMDTLTKEMSGILNWVLMGLDYFYKYGMPEKTENEHALMDALVDDVEDFGATFVDKYLANGEETIRSKKIYMTFLNYMELTEGVYSVRRFHKDLHRCLPGKLRRPLSKIIKRHGDGKYLHNVQILKGGRYGKKHN